MEIDHLRSREEAAYDCHDYYHVPDIQISQFYASPAVHSFFELRTSTYFLHRHLGDRIRGDGAGDLGNIRLMCFWLARKFGASL